MGRSRCRIGQDIAMCLYVLREKCTGVQKNSAFGALCEASGAFHICGANISGRRYFVRWAEMNFMEKGPAEKQVLFLVEMGGVEPPSESTLTGTSPSAYGHLYSLPCAPAVRLAESVASLCVVCSKLCTLTGTTDRRSVPGRGPPGGNAR